MAIRALPLLVATVVAIGVTAPEAAASESLRPPVTWLKGEGNFTKAHRAPSSLRAIVVHVTEGRFWGSVQWLKSPRAHASSHFVVSRRGRIVQLVHVSDIAWHAGNWRVNRGSIGIEHEGFTYGAAGFTAAQYESSARLTAWLARRALMPIDRRHVLGHADVPGPRGGKGGASHHSDPGPHWSWPRYLELVRHYASGRQTLSVETRLPAGPLLGIVPWRAKTAGGVRTVEFVIDGRVASTDRRAPFSFGGGRGLNTTRLANGSHVLELRAYGDGTRHDVTRRTVIVENAAFRLTSAGAREWTLVRGTVRLRVRASGAKVRAVELRVDGRPISTDTRAPYVLVWDTRRVRDRKHVVELVAQSVDGRVASQRLPLVVRNRPLRPKVQPQPKPKPTLAPPTPVTPPPVTPPAPPPLEIVEQTVAETDLGGTLMLWRVFVLGRVDRVVFLIDGAARGTDRAAPYTLGWDTSGEAPGPHTLTARAYGTNGKTVTASLDIAVTGIAPAVQASAGSAAP